MDAIRATAARRIVRVTRSKRSVRRRIGGRVSSYLRHGMIWHRMLALLLLPFVLPLIGMLIVLIRLTSLGPAIYRQQRVGLHGRLFTMYKLRTMYLNAEAGIGAVWAQPDDPRTTRIGSVLRTYHLDELPQLFNVVKGEMALVGPRPERPEFVVILRRKIPRYERRLLALPGVTGLAQLCLPPDTDTDSVRRKLKVDLRYIAHASLWMDLRIIFYTAARVFKLPSTYLTFITGLTPWLQTPTPESETPAASAKQKRNRRERLEPSRRARLIEQPAR
jgi:lipopolysaccharide/colanic/teichoic acid biosynthesis glycosyltransferase